MALYQLVSAFDALATTLEGADEIEIANRGAWVEWSIEHLGASI